MPHAPILAATWHQSQGKPLVLLHGLLGSQNDWAALLPFLQDIPGIRPLTLDLPYHGQSRHIGCEHFAEMRQILARTLEQRLGDESFYLLGYSLGGRIALDYALNMRPKNLKGVLLEGANIGLNREEARVVRRQNDEAWARRFATEAIETVLADWYQQAVFSDLTFAARRQLIEKRSHNDGGAIAEMLRATGLARQDFLLPGDEQIQFIVGEKDAKFRQMCETYHLSHRLIANAGHNTHIANPLAFARVVAEFMSV